jgi:hypothetical protein
MATYGDNPAEYPYMPPKRKKQKYSLQTRVVDFTNNLPITSGKWNQTGNATTAWAASDVLQILRVRAGQTVLGVQVEILTYSADSGDFFDIGYGSDTNRWGRVDMYRKSPASKSDAMQIFPDPQTKLTEDNDYMKNSFGLYGSPMYFSSGDSIDILIGKAAMQGKVRIIVHLLEDDR